jgi:hypothetical protein
MKSSWHRERCSIIREWQRQFGTLLEGRQAPIPQTRWPPRHQERGKKSGASTRRFSPFRCCRLLPTVAHTHQRTKTVAGSLQTVAFCCTLLHSGRIGSLQPWCLNVGTRVFSTIYDDFRQISTQSTAFDCFRHLAARITLQAWFRGPKHRVVEHKGLSDELVEFFSYLIGIKSL